MYMYMCMYIIGNVNSIYISIAYIITRRVGEGKRPEPVPGNEGRSDTGSFCLQAGLQKVVSDM